MVSLSPVISRLSTFIALMLICPALVVTGCGKDELGGTFQAPDRDPEDNDLGPKSPLEVGTEYWFSMNRSYKRTSESDSSGATQGEAQSVGHMCIKITEVKDTATELKKMAKKKTITDRTQIEGMLEKVVNPCMRPEILRMVRHVWVELPKSSEKQEKSLPSKHKTIQSYFKPTQPSINKE